MSGAGITTYGASAWISSLFGLSALSGSYWLAALTQPPDENLDGTDLAALEPTDAAYARYELPMDSGTWVSNSDGCITNLNELTYPTPTADWDQIAYYALCSAVTAGEVYVFGQYQEPLLIRIGVPLVVPASAITFGLATQVETVSA